MAEKVIINNSEIYRVMIRKHFTLEKESMRRTILYHSILLSLIITYESLASTGNNVMTRFNATLTINTITNTKLLETTLLDPNKTNLSKLYCLKLIHSFYQICASSGTTQNYMNMARKQKFHPYLLLHSNKTVSSLQFQVLSKQLFD